LTKPMTFFSAFGKSGGDSLVRYVTNRSLRIMNA
jgi:hypothetical protein